MITLKNQILCFYCSVLLLFSSCAKLPVANTKFSSFIKLEVGPGPEDMVLDTISSPDPRLLVSCAERRTLSKEFGEIYAVGLRDGKSEILPRINNPENLHFRPHGTDLVRDSAGNVLLYCISHNERQKEHSIIIYKVFSDRLEFLQKLDHSLLVSPNDVAATSSGEIFVTNDAGKRNSLPEALFKLKRSSVVHYSPVTREWKIFAKTLLYANGIAIADSAEIIVSTVRQNALFSFDKQNSNNRKLIARLFGLDNISFVNANEILVTAHPSLWKFLRHYKDASQKSPSVVYRVNIKTGNSNAVFSDDGSLISAVSTAVQYGGKLYLVNPQQ